MKEMYEIVKVEKNSQHLIGRFENKVQAQNLYDEIVQYYEHNKQPCNVQFKVLPIITEDVAVMRFCAHASILTSDIINVVSVCPFVASFQNSPCAEEYVQRARQKECILGIFCYGSSEQEARDKLENVIGVLKAENLLQSAVEVAHQNLNLPY